MLHFHVYFLNFYNFYNFLSPVEIVFISEVEKHCSRKVVLYRGAMNLISEPHTCLMVNSGQGVALFLKCRTKRANAVCF
jgi:hypothetical protein